MAKQGQMDAVKIMAKDLVRTRRYVKKFMLMRANIQAVSLKIQTLKSQSAMANAMKGVTKAMGSMSKHSSSVSENSDFEITISYGQRNEGCHKGNGQHEQTDEITRDTKNYDGI